MHLKSKICEWVEPNSNALRPDFSIHNFPNKKLQNSSCTCSQHQAGWVGSAFLNMQIAHSRVFFLTFSSMWTHGLKTQEHKS